MTEEIQPGGLEMRGGGGQRAAASTSAHMGRGRGMGAKGWGDGPEEVRIHTHKHTRIVTDLEGPGAGEWISRRQRPEALVAHRDNGGPAAGVGFAGGLGLRLQECNLCVSRMARRTRARRLIAAAGGRPEAASRLRLPLDKKSQRRKKAHGPALATTPDFVGACLVRLPTVPGLVAGLGSHGGPRCQVPFCGFRRLFAGNSEVG